MRGSSELAGEGDYRRRCSGGSSLRTGGLAAILLGFWGEIELDGVEFIWTRGIGTNTASFARIRSPNGIVLRPVSGAGD